MPRLNIIVLTQMQPNDYDVVFWADVPAARQTFYANPSAKSAWAGATTTDNTNLQTGVMVEQQQMVRVPPGTTLAQAQAFLQAQWQTFQTYITNNNPWAHYGSTWDGTTWVMATVA